MRSVVIEPYFEAWRDQARLLLAQGAEPSTVLWLDAMESSLFWPDNFAPSLSRPLQFKISAEFLDLARSVAAHTSPQRWALLYRMVWRITHGKEKYLLGMTTDPDVRQAQNWRKAIGRDIHKMHAYVRFRLVDTDAASGREKFIAWYEPDYRIVRLATPFFEKRFAGMDWSILTPTECVHWDGVRLHFSPGLSRSEAPAEDAQDDLWRTYYRSIFNPARLKIKMMQSEMPKKFWKNLPEASIIPELIASSRDRTQKMLDTENRPLKPAPKNAYLASLHRMNENVDE